MQDERNQILSAYLWIRQSWYDAYLKWDKDKYDGLDSIRIPSNLVWRPDIVLYNKWVWVEKISLNICVREGGGEGGIDAVWTLSFHFALAKGCFVVLTFVVDNLNILQWSHRQDLAVAYATQESCSEFLCTGNWISWWSEVLSAKAAEELWKIVCPQKGGTQRLHSLLALPGSDQQIIFIFEWILILFEIKFEEVMVNKYNIT